MMGLRTALEAYLSGRMELWMFRLRLAQILESSMHPDRHSTLAYDLHSLFRVSAELKWPEPELRKEFARTYYRHNIVVLG